MAAEAPDPHTTMSRDGNKTIHKDRKVQITDPTKGGWVTKRPATTAARLILNFDPAKCCSVGPGFPDDIEKLPGALAERGVTQYEWADFMNRLQHNVQPMHWSTCACITVGMTVIGLPLVCYVEGKYQEAAMKWINDLNKEVLVPKGLYAKFQTNHYYQSNGNSSYSEEISWLAVALTPEEVEMLRNEPVFWSPGCCAPTTVPNSCQRCFCCCCRPRVV